MWRISTRGRALSSRSQPHKGVRRRISLIRKNSDQPDTERRSFLKASTYVAPAILTLHVAPVFASFGSQGNNGVGNGFDPQPRGNPLINDGWGTGPGNPGNRR